MCVCVCKRPSATSCLCRRLSTVSCASDADHVTALSRMWRKCLLLGTQSVFVTLGLTFILYEKDPVY